MAGLINTVGILTHLSLASFKCVTQANSADPDRTLQNTASDQGLCSLLTECSIKFQIKIKNITEQPIKQKWPGPIDNSGKFHSAYMGFENLLSRYL